MILLFVLLFIGVVLIFGSAIKNNSQSAVSSNNEIEQGNYNTHENDVFKRAGLAEKYKEMPDGSRTMKGYYDHRAYLGAPPMIPHALLSEVGIGGKACLQCHQNGGFVSVFDAYAPVAPHPEWLNCRQCHLPIKDNELFKMTNWEKPEIPILGNKALMTSPLIMPHGLQNRENCLSCHGGPSAPKEIRVTHPERINCRQCHVPQNTDHIFLTPVESRQSYFIRNEVSRDTSEKINKEDVDNIKNWIENENSQDD